MYTVRFMWICRTPVSYDSGSTFKMLFIDILPCFRFVNHALKYPDMQEKFLVSKQVSRKVLDSLSFVFIKDESD